MTLRKLRTSVWLGAMLIVGISACNSNNKPGNASDRVDTSDMVNTADTTLLPTEALSGKGTECYEWVKGRDTIKMTLQQTGEEVTGDLAYRFYEKDKSSGPIAGEMIGDTILAEYTFNSEGMQSVREVIFVRREGKLYEGYGDAEERGGRVVFKNRAAIKFGEGAVLSRIACQ